MARRFGRERFSRYKKRSRDDDYPPILDDLIRRGVVPQDGAPRDISGMPPVVPGGGGMYRPTTPPIMLQPRPPMPPGQARPRTGPIATPITRPPVRQEPVIRPPVGDPGMSYIGGNPYFDERTGQLITPPPPESPRPIRQVPPQIVRPPVQPPRIMPVNPVPQGNVQLPDPVRPPAGPGLGAGGPAPQLPDPVVGAQAPLLPDPVTQPPALPRPIPTKPIVGAQAPFDGTSPTPFTPQPIENLGGPITPIKPPAPIGGGNVQLPDPVRPGIHRPPAGPVTRPPRIMPIKPPAPIDDGNIQIPDPVRPQPVKPMPMTRPPVNPGIGRPLPPRPPVGDPGMSYTGGSPYFDPRTGTTRPPVPVRPKPFNLPTKPNPFYPPTKPVQSPYDVGDPLSGLVQTYSRRQHAPEEELPERPEIDPYMEPIMGGWQDNAYWSSTPGASGWSNYVFGGLTGGGRNARSRYPQMED